MSQIKVDSIVPRGGIPSGAEGGGIIQVVSEVYTDTFNTTSTSFTSITGFNAAITPRSTSSKIHVMVYMGAAGTNASNLDNPPAYIITRNGSSCDLRGAAAGSRNRYAMKGHAWSYNSDHMSGGICIMGIDTPASTSTQTYQMTVSVQNSGIPFYLNRTANDNDGSQHWRMRTFSSSTLMEVSG